jgi:GT2 family glycosyltransferase
MRSIRSDVTRGPATARNKGWRDAAAPMVAFTDDDCVPQPAWLATLHAALGDAEIVQGRTMGNPTQQASGYFAWAPEANSERGFYETCNIGYRRDTLASVDGFDEVFLARPGRRGSSRVVAPLWGEDSDLALRAKDAGARSAFAGEAVVWHDVKPGGLRDRLRDVPRRRGMVLAVKRHPALRNRFESRWFLQRTHAYIAGGAVAGVLIAFRPTSPWRWLLGATFGVAWARRRSRDYPARVWHKALPQWLLVDTAEVAVLAVASARQRTLFL